MHVRELQSVDRALQALGNPHIRMQFSQFGEDVIIESMLETFGMRERPGFFVDVGAHHPYYLSNTCLFHMKGWTGINIDANPESVALFAAARPGDTNLHAVISDEPGIVEFAVFASAAVSTADPGARARVEQQGMARTSLLQLSTRRLGDVLAEIVTDGRRIDLMSVDVEGYDLRVLRSNDWQRFAPFFLLVEDPALSLLDRPNSEIFNFLKPLGYRLASQAFITSIYVRDQI
jgi:FkbM family methyltransferase